MREPDRQTHRQTNKQEQMHINTHSSLDIYLSIAIYCQTFIVVIGMLEGRAIRVIIHWWISRVLTDLTDENDRWGDRWEKHISLSMDREHVMNEQRSCNEQIEKLKWMNREVVMDE